MNQSHIVIIFALLLSILVGYQNCSKAKFSNAPTDQIVEPLCTPQDIQNWLDASWVSNNNLTLADLSTLGNDGSFYVPYTTTRYFWADGTPLCNGTTNAACTTSDYNKLSYFLDYAQTDHTATIAAGTPDYIAGYRTNVYLNRTALTRQPFQELRLQVTLANRWCKAQRDSNGHPIYSAGLVDFDANPNLPGSYLPNQNIQVRCVAINAPVSNGCDNYSNNPPVVTQAFRYNEDYIARCTSINNNPSLTPLQKNQQCGTLLCGARGYQAGYMVEFNALTNGASAICFHDANFYNQGW